jgi:hypothetical protein
MNWKGFGRKLSWPNFKVLPGIRLEGQGKTKKNPQSGYLVSWAEYGTRDLQNKKLTIISIITDWIFYMCWLKYVCSRCFNRRKVPYCGADVI